MTLDEAIKHAEEVAESFDRLCKRYDDASRHYRTHNEDIVSVNAKKSLECFECAKENRQLAKWLKDYKRLLEQQPCEDAISRQAVLDIWHTTYSDNREENEETQYKKIAFELPPVTPQPCEEREQGKCPFYSN